MDNVLAGLGLSIAAYLIGLWVHRHSGRKSYVHPVAVGSLIVVALLLWLGTAATEQYLEHNTILLELLIVAVVAFSVPLVDNVRTVLRELDRLVLAVTLIALLIAASTVALGYVARLDAPMISAMSLRSVTTPIAIVIAEKNAISVDLTMFTVFVAGLFGVLTAERLLAWIRITDERMVGLVLGITSHAFGIARAIEISSIAAAYATVGMIFTGMLYAFVVPWVLRLAM
jgi:putative effector of murein hydrolase